MMLVSRRYLRRHLVKLIIVGSLSLGLVLYFQLDTSNQDTYLVAAPKRQSIQFQASKRSEDEVKHSYEAREVDMRNKFQEGNHDPEENVRVHRDHEPWIDGPIHHDTANQRSIEQLLTQKVHDIPKDIHHKEPHKFDNLLDKADDFDLDEQRIEGVMFSDSEKDGIDTARHVDNKTNLNSNHTVVRHTEKEAMETSKQLGQESVNPIPRRKLNNNQVLQSNTRRKKLSVAQKSVQGGKPEIRIMPKHPSVPEGHTLMVTCADVMVLARRKSRDEAMYMTFELPQSLSRQLKSTVHILVRPGRLTVCMMLCMCMCV